MSVAATSASSWPPALVTKWQPCALDVALAALVVFLGFAFRLYWNVGSTWPNPPDTKTYLDAGRELVSGQIMHSVHVMPLFPLLTTIIGEEYFRQFNLTLHALTAGLCYVLARTIFGSRLSGVLAGIACAISPTLIFWSYQMITETPYTFLLTATLTVIALRNVAATSVLLPLGTLLRPALDFISPALVLCAVPSPFTWRKAGKAVGLYALIYLVFLTPWWVHNYQKYGAFVWHNQSGPPMLVMENQPIMNGMDIDLGRIQDLGKLFPPMAPLWSTPGGWRPQAEAMTKAAIDYVKTYPGQFIYNCFDRAKRFFNAALLQRKDYDWWFMLHNLIAYALCIACLFRAPGTIQRELLPLYLSIAMVSAVHIVTHSNTRYRAPLDPLFFVIGWGFAGMLLSKRLSSLSFWRTRFLR